MTEGQKRLLAMLPFNPWIRIQIDRLQPRESFRLYVPDTIYILSYEEAKFVVARLVLEGKLG